MTGQTFNKRMVKEGHAILGQDFSTRVIRFPGGHMTWQRNDPKGMETQDKALQDKDYHQIDWNVLPEDAEGSPKNAEGLYPILSFKNC